jgi:hypothetical protein
VDEVFSIRDGGKEKRSRYRAIAEHGLVLDVHFRDHLDTEPATANVRRTLGSVGIAPYLDAPLATALERHATALELVHRPPAPR